MTNFSPETDFGSGSGDDENLNLGGEDWSSEVTYWLWRREQGFDDILEKAGKSLKEFFKYYKVSPVIIDNDRVLFLARFEIQKYGESSQYDQPGTAGPDIKGFVDFLSGFPMECTEMVMMIGEISSRAAYKAGKVPVQNGKGEVTSPMPESFFVGFEDEATLLTYIYLDTDYAMCWVNSLSGETEPQGLKWWVRVPFKDQIKGIHTKLPYPGEFLALGIRLMPDKPWWDQETSPFLFAGNFIDTLYYSSGVVTEVQPPKDGQPYPTYTVLWRNKSYSPVMATDFTEYKVKDRVVLLKNVETEKKSQLWKDDDMDPDKNEDLLKRKWAIAPMMFYGIDPEKED